MAERATTEPHPPAHLTFLAPLLSRLAPLRRRYESGVLAAPLALAPGFLLAALVGVPTPLEPLAEAIMQWTPVGIANVLLGTLGPFARMAALLGAIAVTLPVCGLIAVSAPGRAGRAPTQPLRHRLARWAATALLALLATIPLALAATTPAGAACAVVTGLAFAPALALIRHVHPDAMPAARDASEASAGGLSRRTVLRGLLASGATVAGALALGAFDVWSAALDTALGRGEVSRTLFRFTPSAPRAPGFPVAGVEPEVTPIPRFYLLSKNDVDPLIEPRQWTLRVSGAVNRPFALSYAQLLALPRADQYVTLRCVNNPPGGHLMSTAYWSGAPLAPLLDRAGIASGATALVLRAPDAYDEVIPLDAARAPTALLAYGMNGQTLPRSHGGPVRALIPGYFGFKNVKWVTSVEVVSSAQPDYWARRGWAAAQVHSVARIDAWQSTSSELLIAGVAFGGARGVSAVQVRADDGPWHDAELNAPALSPFAWVQWRATLSLAPGHHMLTARMTDGDGQQQVTTPRGEYPGGATGLDSQQVTV